MQLTQTQESIIKTKAQIVQKILLNHDCYIYKLKFIDKSFQLKIGQSIRIIQTISTKQHPQGEKVMRKYTPISPCSQKDTIDILIKIYRPNTHPNFPEGGKLTPYIESLNVSDIVNIQGPYGRFVYEGNGKIIINGEKITKKKIFFIAGGTGITPCYQTVRQIAQMKDETIQLVLLFCNKEERDILLRKELDQIGNRVKIYYMLDKGGQNWGGLTGYVNQDILNKICPLSQQDTLYIHCGPAPMTSLIKQIFQEKYPKSTLFKY